MRQTIRGRREEIALSAAAIDRISAWTVEALEQAGTDKKEQIRLRLAVEELPASGSEAGAGTRCSFGRGTLLPLHRDPGQGEATPADMLEGGTGGEYCTTTCSPRLCWRCATTGTASTRYINPPKRAAMDQFSQMFLAIAAASSLELRYGCPSACSGGGRHPHPGF